MHEKNHHCLQYTECFVIFNKVLLSLPCSVWCLCVASNCSYILFFVCFILITHIYLLINLFSYYCECEPVCTLYTCAHFHVFVICYSFLEMAIKFASDHVILNTCATLDKVVLCHEKNDFILYLFSLFCRQNSIIMTLRKFISRRN